MAATDHTAETAELVRVLHCCQLVFFYKTKANFKTSGYYKLNSRCTEEGGLFYQSGIRCISETAKNHEVARFIFFRLIPLSLWKI